MAITRAWEADATHWVYFTPKPMPSCWLTYNNVHLLKHGAVIPTTKHEQSVPTILATPDKQERVIAAACRGSPRIL